MSDAKREAGDAVAQADVAFANHIIGRINGMTDDDTAWLPYAHSEHWLAVDIAQARHTATAELVEALKKAKALLDVIEQRSANNCWWVNAHDPEVAVCDTYDAVNAALARAGAL